MCIYIYMYIYYDTVVVLLNVIFITVFIVVHLCNLCFSEFNSLCDCTIFCGSFYNNI